jgi:hypothetical protein
VPRSPGRRDTFRPRRNACSTWIRPATVAAVTFCVAAGATGGAFEFEVVSLSGDLFDPQTGEIIHAPGIPSISQAGVIGAAGMTNHPSLGIRRGLFLWEDGVLSRAAKEGDPLADHPNFAYQRFGVPRFDVAGNLLFFADYSTGSGDHVAFVHLEQLGSLDRRERSRSDGLPRAPGGPGRSVRRGARRDEAIR